MRTLGEMVAEFVTAAMTRRKLSRFISKAATCRRSVNLPRGTNFVMRIDRGGKRPIE